jgi:hypothetical protein
MEHFVDDYFSVKFKKTYARRIEQLGERSMWPKVDVEAVVGAPLGKRPVGRQRKNRIKGFLEGGSGKKLQEMTQKNQRNSLEASSNVQIV